MDAATLDLAKGLINPAYVRNAQDALARTASALTSLLAQRQLPERGWTDEQIEALLGQLALMDSNNYVGNVGVGEREGRVWSQLVRRRHYGMSHGIGRSGDLTANQPKAAGSSLLYTLANLMAADALRVAGAKRTKAAIVVPTATGMALTLVLQSLPAVRARPADPTAPLERKRWVVWSRIDQKTCLKCIYAAGFEAKVVPLKREGDFFVTDIAGVEAAVRECGADNVACVLTTTSCFAPRLPDKVLDVARLCAREDIAHVVNNAYGVQSAPVMKALNAAMEHGRVDAFVQSGDKNFMVPVGGSIVASPSEAFLAKVSATYAGRASSSAVTDLFITLLSLGRQGFARLLAERAAALGVFHEKVAAFAATKGERLLAHPANDVSFCLTIDSLPKGNDLGSALFNHCVSGPRTVPVGVRKEICGNAFNNYGSHSDETDYSYLTMACAIGIDVADIDPFFVRLEAEWKKIAKKAAKRRAQQDAADATASPPSDPPQQQS